MHIHIMRLLVMCKDSEDSTSTKFPNKVEKQKMARVLLFCCPRRESPQAKRCIYLSLQHVVPVRHEQNIVIQKCAVPRKSSQSLR
jgi:hypothetical protein